MTKIFSSLIVWVTVCNGIMSPQIDNGDFRKAVDGNLVFSQEQSELMRTAIGAAE
jgi:hypothetical protein